MPSSPRQMAPASRSGMPAQAERLLAAAPLDPAALTYLGLAADKKGDASAPRRLMTLAVRSDGRALRARLWLMDQDLRHARLWQRHRAFRSAGADRPARHHRADQRHDRDRPRSGEPRAARPQAGDQPAMARHLPLCAQPAGRVARRHLSADAAGFRPRRRCCSNKRRCFSRCSRTTNMSAPIWRGSISCPNRRSSSSARSMIRSSSNLPGPLPFNWQLTDGSDGSSEFSKPQGLNGFLSRRQCRDADGTDAATVARAAIACR